MAAARRGCFTKKMVFEVSPITVDGGSVGSDRKLAMGREHSLNKDAET